MDSIDQRLLTELTKGLPLEHRPFEAVGQKLSMSEQECLERTARLKATLAIRRVSAVFDPRGLGYQRTVIAMRGDLSHLDAAAEAVSRYPGVSVSELRNDPFHLWCTVSVPPHDTLEHLAQIFHTLAKAHETILLPALRVYKTDSAVDRSQGDMLEYPEEFEDAHRGGAAPSFSADDLRFIRVVQEELPLIEMPYAVWAEQAESTEETVFTWARAMERTGILRRIGALGTTGRSEGMTNVLVIWQVPPEQADAVGEQIAGFRDVSHCCRRPVYPSWPYPLFTTIRGSTETACVSAVKRIEDQLGRVPRKLLFSIKTYQKKRVTYFDPALDEWYASARS